MADIADYPGLLAEINAALVRYGAVGAFTVSAAHEHFPMDHEAGEVLLETCDENRTLTTRPVKISDLPRERVGASEWFLDRDSKPHPVRFCEQGPWEFPAHSPLDDVS